MLDNHDLLTFHVINMPFAFFEKKTNIQNKTLLHFLFTVCKKADKNIILVQTQKHIYLTKTDVEQQMDQKV